MNFGEKSDQNSKNLKIFPYQKWFNLRKKESHFYSSFLMYFNIKIIKS
jgi:hypothetical protein